MSEALLVHGSAGPEPVGREAESAAIGTWLAAAEEGREPPTGETVLAIEGDPGIGKTTVWAEAIRRARLDGWTVLSCGPRPSDTGLSHLGLTDILGPVSDEAIRELPSPQRRALLIATLREEPGTEALDPRAVGAGLTALLDALSDRAPLLLAVDDLQWLDRASARSMAFAVRRLDHHRVRLLAAIRLEGSRRESPALVAMESALGREQWRRLRMGPLSVAALHQVLVKVVGGSFPRPLVVRIHRAAAGNPFYALEIARELERVGPPSPGGPLPVPEEHRDMALLRVRRLPQATRDVLAQVAAMSRPSADALDLAALAPAEEAGIVRVQPGGHVDFTHPLFGSALYSSLTESVRRGLHRELARKSSSLEEQARHLALAAPGPDEQIAAALDSAAETAGARGAADMVVEFKRLALQLTPPSDQDAVVRRELELADRRYFAGDATGARRQLEQCLASVPSGEGRAQILLELGSVLWTQGEEGQGLALMSQALEDAESSALRARIHSRASAMAEDFDLGVEHAEAALALMDEREDPLLYSFALHNAARCKLFAGRGADHAAVQRGMHLQHEAAAWEVSVLPAYWALYFDDFDTARARFEELIRVLRDRGDEARGCVLLAHLAVLEALTGRMERARSLADEAVELAKQTEQDTWTLVALWAKGQVAARGGDLDAARLAAQEVLAQLEIHPDITLENMARAVLGLAALSSGDFAEVDRQLTRSDAILELYHAREPAPDRFHADHAEAVISLGDLERAERLVQRLEERAAALPRPWILAVARRSRGLLNAARGDLDAAAADYQHALEAHRALAVPSELGRTLLALGRLHRRRNQRRCAQECLAEAVRTFEKGGVMNWAALAREELRRARGRRGRGQELTPTERKVAELAASGLRNREIATRMFLSEKTVEANLSRVYVKLDIRSRAELGRRLPAKFEGTSSKT
ncbi:MAG TPA: AAA family ATPase [Solirubrobacteraceae bacterium]